jgi:hypothetical protein
MVDGWRIFAVLNLRASLPEKISYPFNTNKNNNMAECGWQWRQLTKLLELASEILILAWILDVLTNYIALGFVDKFLAWRICETPRFCVRTFS